MKGPGVARIPAPVLVDAATALVIARAEIDALKDEIAKLRAERTRMVVAIADRDEKISELQAIANRAHTGAP